MENERSSVSQLNCFTGKPANGAIAQVEGVRGLKLADIMEQIQNIRAEIEQPQAQMEAGVPSE